MKIYRLEISNIKDLKNLTEISGGLNFYDVVLATANTSTFATQDLKNFLKHEEIKKLDEYKSEVSKINFAVSRSILNKALETTLKIPLEDVVILRNEYNKPYIKNKNEIKFNISHTAGYVVVCFSKRRIGVDIEKVNYDFEFECILRDCFTHREIKNIGFDTSMFYKYWTAKEAYLKCEGCGFMRSPKEIEVIHIDNQTIEVEDNIKRINKDLAVLSLSSGKYFGAVCIQEEA